MERWNGLDWNGGMEWNGEMIEDLSATRIIMIHSSSLNHIAGHVNTILIILVQVPCIKQKFSPFL